MSDSLQQPSPYLYVDSVYTNGTADNKIPVTLEESVNLLNWYQKELGECRAALTASQERERKLRDVAVSTVRSLSHLQIQHEMLRGKCPCDWCDAIKLLTAALKEGGE